MLSEDCRLHSIVQYDAGTTLTMTVARQRNDGSDVPPEEQENHYAEMAKACSRGPLPPHERIFSIVYMHDGVEWTATVGEQLHGTKTTTKRGREHRSLHSDPATVLTIFSGNPYMVVTNKGPFFGSVKPQWENPFMSGTPKQVKLFSQA